MNNLLERMAAQEHRQWAHWVAHMLDNLTDINIERWRSLIITEYDELSEKAKASDREWAQRMGSVIGVSHVLVPRELDHDTIEAIRHNMLTNRIIVLKQHEIYDAHRAVICTFKNELA